MVGIVYSDPLFPPMFLSPYPEARQLMSTIGAHIQGTFKCWEGLGVGGEGEQRPCCLLVLTS